MSETIHRHQINARMSKIVSHAGLVYLCGQTSSGCEIEDATGQTREVPARVDALLGQAGSDRPRILAATIHLRDMVDLAAMNAVCEAWQPAGCSPARTTVEARLTSPALRAEVTVVAAGKWSTATTSMGSHSVPASNGRPRRLKPIRLGTRVEFEGVPSEADSRERQVMAEPGCPICARQRRLTDTNPPFER